MKWINPLHDSVPNETKSSIN